MKKWKSADGKKLFPSEMTSSHLIHAVRICESVPPVQFTIDVNKDDDIDCDMNPDYEMAQEWIQLFEKELKKRSTDYNEVDITFNWIKRKNKYAKTIKHRGYLPT